MALLHEHTMYKHFTNDSVHVTLLLIMSRWEILFSGGLQVESRLSVSSLVSQLQVLFVVKDSMSYL